MKATTTNIQTVANEVTNTKTRSAWSKGVKAYALEILESFEEWRRWNEENGESVPELDEVTALNGASDWSAWSYGGCGLVYNAYIAERLCTPSELRKLDGGTRVPAGAATWCDIEARAARQAWRMIADAVRKKVMTKVVFRYDKKAEEVLAVFPELGNRANYRVLCYAHIGQHFEASHPQIIATTQPATIEQYSALLAELEAIGYDDLRVVKRCRPIYK